MKGKNERFHVGTRSAYFNISGLSTPCTAEDNPGYTVYKGNYEECPKVTIETTRLII